MFEGITNVVGSEGFCASDLKVPTIPESFCIALVLLGMIFLSKNY